MKISRKHTYSTRAPTPAPAAPESVEQYLARGGRVESLPAFGAASQAPDPTFKDSAGKRCGRVKAKHRVDTLDVQDRETA